MSAPTKSEPADELGAGFWVGAVIGLGIMAFGIKGLLDAAPATRPGQVAFGAIGLDVLHDALIAPIACIVGALLSRFLPRSVRAPVRAGLFATAIVIVVGWAALRGYGRAYVPDNPTVDPLSYGTAVFTVIAIVWAAAGTWATIAWLRSRRTAENPHA